MTYDRYGDDADEPHATAFQAHRCRNGWVGEDDHGRPIPCTVCKPHLSRTDAR